MIRNIKIRMLKENDIDTRSTLPTTMRNPLHRILDQGEATILTLEKTPQTAWKLQVGAPSGVGHHPTTNLPPITPPDIQPPPGPPRVEMAGSQERR
mmetsp:Transcript_27436/g.37856  ORF Transcript_27436/g.37856 Transcript_27436/m.37856 type:complete len:96 (-) Transcript_27436:306-593(-)